jgi:hypothetical protein
MVPGVTPYYLHLVRDPRAVAYSWSRRKPDPDLSRKELIRHGPLFSATNWLGVNVTASSIGRREPSRYMLLRYEDFVGAPMETLRSIAAFVDEPCAGAVFVDDKTPVLTRHHTVAGNPSRFASGPTALRPRESWRGGLPPLHAAVVDAICLPLMLRYGYDPGRARRAPAAAPSPEGP